MSAAGVDLLRHLRQLNIKSGTTTNNDDQCGGVTEGIDSVDAQDDTSTCASCGKIGNSHDMNVCNKCKEVKYCNAACKKKHRKKHKKACEKRAAELHDEQLFKEVEECPLCMRPLPNTAEQMTSEPCCGKLICHGCTYAMVLSGGKDLCAFCRTPYASSEEEEMKRLKNLMDKGNGWAFAVFGTYYAKGEYGMPQDRSKAVELLLKAGELGFTEAYYNVGNAYSFGRGVEVDDKMAKHYYELAAMGGNVAARHNLGCMEDEVGNAYRAMKHFMIAARAGDKGSLDAVQCGYE